MRLYHRQQVLEQREVENGLDLQDGGKISAPTMALIGFHLKVTDQYLPGDSEVWPLIAKRQGHSAYPQPEAMRQVGH